MRPNDPSMTLDCDQCLGRTTTGGRQPASLLPSLSSSEQAEVQRAALMDGMNKAIASIPGYIELCTLFVIFTPNCAHADRCDERGVRSKLSLASWRRRGWCRTEFLGARPAITRMAPWTTPHDAS